MPQYSFLFKSSGTNADRLLTLAPSIAVIDDESNFMTRDSVAEVQDSNTTLFAYLSIGEAESYRQYWREGGWDTNRPSFVLGTNSQFQGAFYTKFWDPAWQQLVTNRMVDLVKKGYEGVMFDVVDVFNVQQVRDAYTAAFPNGNIQTAMQNFVIHLSQTAKAINPDFKIVPNNAPELFANEKLQVLGQTLTPNTTYLNAIDGLVKESLFSNNNIAPAPYTPFDKRYVDLASAAGKFVLDIEYPTDPTVQQQVITQAIREGYIPFIGNRALDGNIDPINATIPNLVSPAKLQQITDDTTIGQRMNGTEGNNAMIGAQGPDTIVAFGGHDSVFAQAGHDSINLGDGDDLAYGGSGNDTIYGLDGNDTAFGGSGNDVLFGWKGEDSLVGGEGDDFMGGDAGNDTLVGGNGNDALYGWTGDDVLTGGNGNDLLMGEVGRDSLAGDDGNDTVYAGSEADTASGGEGEDYLLGDDGDDSLMGDAGSDTVFAGTGNDTVAAGTGNDLVGGDDGNDSLRGNEGHDSLFGWTGNDTLAGDAGNDQLSGEDGADSLDGGLGNDSVFGGIGNDTLAGGGNSGTANLDRGILQAGDILVGNAGNDVFLFRNGVDGVQQIADFTKGEDIFLLQGFSGGSFNTTIAPNLYYTSYEAWIFLGADQGIKITNMQAGSLSASDFSFV